MKTLDIILIIFACAVFTGYNLPIALKYGIQKSISATYNVLKGARKGYYSLFIIGISFPMMIVMNTTLGFWAGALLMLDFAAPTGGDKLQRFLHNFGANGGIILAFTALGVNFHLWYLAIIMGFFSLFAVRELKNSTYWIETAAFILVITGLIIKSLIN